MRTSAHIILLFLIASLPTSSFAMKEFPFCPSGGPQGWMNYFEHRHNKNLWQQYNQYQHNRSYMPENYLPAYSYDYGYNGYPGYDSIYTPENIPLYNRPDYRQPYNNSQQ